MRLRFLRSTKPFAIRAVPEYIPVVQRRIARTKDGRDRGELEVEMDWIMPDGQPILREVTTFVFHAGPTLRGVDRITTLTALAKRVLFHDDNDALDGRHSGDNSSRDSSHS